MTPDPLPTLESSIPVVRAALRARRRAAVLSAPPGTGKTTLVPIALLDEPWLGGRRIVVLGPPPRGSRLARRMAFLLGEEVGATVGYRTRDERRVSAAARIEVVTEGILTRRIHAIPSCRAPRWWSSTRSTNAISRPTSAWRSCSTPVGP
ncbi:MAG: hypothetical protein R2705_01155 [Ilumatobacteraceae bacterium]